MLALIFTDWDGYVAKAVALAHDPRALAALRPGMQVFTASAEIDVSFGALRLVLPELAPHIDLSPVQPLDYELTEYRQLWRNRMQQQETTP